MTRIVLFFICIVVSCFSQPQPFDELIRQLDADQFKDRERAEAQLRRIGRPALPWLQKAEGAGNPEIRMRARSAVASILNEEMRRGFKDLAACKDKDMDLERGMWLIARLVEPDLKKAPLDQEFDRLAKALRKALPKGKNSSAREIHAALQTVLFEREGFTGNTENYEHPDNSAIHRVLETKKGLPILLSHVVVAVGDRLDLPVYGLQIPGRYMVKIVGPKESLVIDPFGDGRIESVAVLQRTRFANEQHFQASLHRDTLTRMLRNLVHHFLVVGDGEGAKRTTAMLRILE